MKKSVLIVCFEFPPHEEIGGRRWAKFAKSLLKFGYEVSILTNTLSKNDTSFHWITEEESRRLTYYFIKPNAISTWLRHSDSFLSPFKFRIAKYLLSVLFKGSIYDLSIGLKYRFEKKMVQILEKEKHKTIIVTGAPFNLLFYSACLKKKLPGINLICDFRDPWLSAENYGMKTLTKTRKAKEEFKFQTVVKYADVITAPNAFMLEDIKDESGWLSNKTRFVELPHAFDPDDYKVIESIQKNKNVITIIYAGALYMGIEPWLQSISYYLNQINSKSKANKIVLKIYTPHTDFYKQCLIKNDYIAVSDAIGSMIFEEIAKADLILILLAPHNKNFVTSKFYEYMPYKKPFLYHGPEGFVSNKIEREGLGFCLKNVNTLSEIQIKLHNTNFSSSIEGFTFASITRSILLKLIENN